MPEIVVLGEALIDLFAEPSKGLADTASLRPSPGGAPANVAVALGRLGASVGFIGKVGADAFGELLQATLKKHGVDTTYFTADNNAPTMLAIVAIPNPNEQQFVLYNGANELLDSASLPASYIEEAEVFIYGSVSLATRSRNAAFKAAQLARSAGHHVIFDVNLRPALWHNLEEARTQIEAALTTATIVKVNEIELEFLTGTRDVEKGSQNLLTRGAELCCVSLGKDGAFFSNGKVTGHVPAFYVRVKSTVGSGDTFVAGLAFQVCELEQPIASLKHDELFNIVRFANACGAIVATQEGAMSAKLNQGLVERLVQTRLLA